MVPWPQNSKCQFVVPELGQSCDDKNSVFYYPIKLYTCTRTCHPPSNMATRRSPNPTFANVCWVLISRCTPLFEYVAMDTLISRRKTRTLLCASSRCSSHKRQLHSAVPRSSALSSSFCTGQVYTQRCTAASSANNLNKTRVIIHVN